jgi:hypothetical protein
MLTLAGACLLGWPADDVDLLARAVAAFKANRDAFPHLRVTHTYQVRHAKTVEAAFALPPADPAGRTMVRYVRRDGAVRNAVTESDETRRILDQKAPPTTRWANGMVVGPPHEANGYDYLCADAAGFAFRPRMRSASAVRQEFRSRTYTFSLVHRLYDQLDVAAVAADARAGKYVAACREADGRVVVEFRLPPGATPPPESLLPASLTCLTFELDTKHGYLPVLHRLDCSHKDGRQVSLIYRLSDLRACSDGRWFPGRLQSAQEPVPPNTHVTAHDLVVTDLDADGRPSDADLSVPVPAGTRVVGPDRKWLVTRRDESVGPADLPGLFDRIAGVEPLPNLPNSARADLTDPPPPRPWWRWAGYASAGAFVLAAAVALRRGRR